jgi:hypothetical protein
MTLEFGDGQETDFGDGTGNRTTSHTYSSAGNFNVRASFSAPGRTSVRHTIPLSVQEVSIPAPGGGGSGPISPPPTFGPSDPNVPFSLSSVGWLHTDVSGWAETSQISRVEFDLEGRNVKTICFPHSKAGRWPIIENGEGNVWVFGQIGGRWYAGTWDWLKKGQVCKTANGFYWGEYPHGIGHHVHKPPLETWAPRSGELVGIMVSTHARFGQQGIAERTNVYMTTWP